MSVYYLSFLTSIILIAFLSKKQIMFSKKIVILKKQFWFIAVAPISFLFLFRWGVGVDANWYKGSYPVTYMTILQNPSIPYKTDALFSFVTKIFGALQIPYFWWLFALGAFYLISFYVFVNKWSLNTPISIFLFLTTDLFLFGFGALRQAFAMSFLFLAYCEIKEQKKVALNKKIIVLFVLSFLSHSSALIGILCFCVSMIKIHPRTLMKMAVGCIAICTVTSFLLRKVVEMTSYGKEFIGTEFSENQISVTGIIFSSVILLAILLNYKEILEENQNNYFWINHIFWYYVIMLNSSSLIQTYRIVYYFMPAVVIVVPLLYSVIRKARKRIAFVSLILFVSAFVFWNTYYRHEGKVNYENYSTVFLYDDFLRWN